MAKEQKKVSKVLVNIINKHGADFKDRDSEGRIITEKWETQIIMLDLLLNGGFPKGHSIAFGAVKGAGKTTILIQALGNIVEKYNKNVYYIDVEGGATPELFESMGYSNLLYNSETNPNGKFFVLNMTTIQDIGRLLKALRDSDYEKENTACIVIDSDTFVVDERVLEDESLGLTSKAVAVSARMWAGAAKVFQAIIRETPFTLIYVHQAREDLSGFFVKTTTTGGNAIKHAVSAELIGKTRGYIDANLNETSSRAEAAGIKLEITTDKNRLTTPNAKITLPLIYGRGVSNRWAYQDWLEKNTFTDSATGEIRTYIEKSGSWFTLTLPSIGSQRVQGQVKLTELIDQNIGEVLDLINKNGGLHTEIAEEAEANT